jgi:hypothetical protein
MIARRARFSQDLRRLLVKGFQPVPKRFGLDFRGYLRSAHQLCRDVAFAVPVQRG